MKKSKNRGKEKNRLTSINTTATRTTTTTGESVWPHLNVLNQIMTPVQILNDNSLQQELDFYTTAQFKFNEPNTTRTATTSTVTTPTINNSNSTYFDSMAISNDHHQEYSNTNQYSSNPNYAPFLFNQPQPTISNDGSLLLRHEPSSFKQINQQQQHHQDQHQHQHRHHQQRALQSLYSNNSTPVNSTPSSPIVNYDKTHQQNYFEQHSDHTDQFATMFLSSSTSCPSKLPTETSKGHKNAQTFRFKQDKQPLDSQILSKHNMEQDKRSRIKRPKSKQKAVNILKKKSAKTCESDDDKDARQQDDNDDDNNGNDGGDDGDSGDDDEDEDDDDEDEDGDEPIIGDGAQSYSSMGSNGSRASQPLTKDDKRRRNTAASARFRIKKKIREQALQNTACEMTDKAQRMEQRVHELEREIKWLKALVVEKSEVRIEQLVRERPPNSTAFPTTTTNFPSTTKYPMMTSSNNHGEYEDEYDDDERGGENVYYHQNMTKNRRRH